MRNGTVRLFWVALLCLVLALSVRAQISVSGNLKDLGVSNATGAGTYVLFTLRNYGSNIAKVSGTNVIVSPISSPFKPDANGVISGTIQPTDTISPNGTYYQVCIYYQGQAQWCQNYVINSTPNPWNLNSASPMTTTPIAPAQVLGARTFVFTQGTAATTWTVVHNFNDRNVLVECFNSSGLLLTPSTLTVTDPNTVTVTFGSGQTGTCVVQDASQQTLTTAVSSAVVTNPTANQVIAGYSLSVPSLTLTGAPLPIASGGCNATTAAACLGNLNGASKPAASDAVLYVSTNGSDTKDGLSWGTAKLTLAAALTALPSCIAFGASFNHCGTINMGSGSFAVSSQISITSPEITILGNGPTQTQLAWSGTTGCALSWTSSPFNAYGINESSTGGLFGITIVNNGGSAGTCGLNTFDIIGFRGDFVIDGFSGAGSTGWWFETISHFNEQFDVTARLGNNTIDALLQNTNATTAGDFGYGKLTIYTDSGVASSIGVKFDGGTPGATLSFSQFQFILENSAATATQLQLVNKANITNNMGLIRMEGTAGCTGASIDATSRLVGTLHFTSLCTNSIAAGGVFGPEFPGDGSIQLVQQGNPLVFLASTSTGGGQVYNEWKAANSVSGMTDIKCGVGISSDNRYDCYDLANSQEIYRYSTGASGSHIWFVNNVQQASLGSSGFTANNDLYFNSGTANSGILHHADTANRTYTFPDASGTVGLVLTGSVAASTTALGANSCGDAVTATITGATTTMVATASPQAAISAGLVLSTPFVSAASTVTVGYCNVTTASITPAAATFNIRVMQ